MDETVTSLPIWLNAADVRACLSVADGIASQEEAFALHYKGRIEMPVRPKIKISEHTGELVVMPAYLVDSKALGLKALTWYPHNPIVSEFPAITALVLLFEARTGQPLALMDATSLTALRTAAGSAAASRVLARANARVLGVLGSGPQAEYHILALAEVRPLQLVRIFSPTPAHREALAARLAGQLSLTVEAVSSARRAVEGADILVTATSAREPVISHKWLAPGCHLNCVGSGDPHVRELDSGTLISASKIVVDTLEGALSEAGDILIPIRSGECRADCIYAELGAILAGDLPGRENQDEITIFKSVGVAFQDIAAAWSIYRYARERGIGAKLS